MRKQVFTIGYAGKTLDEFVGALLDAGIDRVVDVRALPLSRRKGFSKTKLGQELAEHGIEYVHLRSAGNPFRAERQDVARCLSLYAGHLDNHPEVVTEVDHILDGHKAALLCVEEHASECHRSVLIDRLKSMDPRRAVKHL